MEYGNSVSLAVQPPHDECKDIGEGYLQWHLHLNCTWLYLIRAGVIILFALFYLEFLQICLHYAVKFIKGIHWSMTH